MKQQVVRFIVIVVVAMLFGVRVAAQQPKSSDKLPTYEVGVDFTTFTLIRSGETHPGVGGRFTYNLNRHVAVDAAGYFSPGNCQFCSGEITGNITEGLFGIKAGQRFKRFGIFGKARPGFVNLSQGSFDLAPTGSSTFSPTSGEIPFTFVTHNRTDFAVDVGPVLEIYPRKKILLRFDGGFIFERVGSHIFHSFSYDPSTNVFQPSPIQMPAFTRKRLQFTAGVGFRF